MPTVRQNAKGCHTHSTVHNTNKNRHCFTTLHWSPWPWFAQSRLRVMFTVSEATMMLSSLACHVHTASVGLRSSRMPWPKLGCLHIQYTQDVKAVSKADQMLNLHKATVRHIEVSSTIGQLRLHAHAPGRTLAVPPGGMREQT